MEEHNLYDPLYGAVTMTGLERALMLTPPLLRARNIKQLGTAAYLRNAPHTRFMHSIGVMHLIGYAMSTLFDGDIPEMRVSVPSRDGGKPRKVNLDAPRVIQCFRAAGLLHDIGHGPLSHVLESYIARLSPKEHRKLWKELDRGGLLCVSASGKRAWPDRPPTHEDVTQLLILDPQMQIAGLLEESGLDPEVVARLALGSFEEEQHACLGSLISGSHDMDRLDYSLRDTYYLGHVGRRIGYSDAFDWQAFLEEMDLYENPKSTTGQQELGISEKGVHLLDQFFALRSHFLREVARNRDVRVADLHFIAALEDLAGNAWTVKTKARLMAEWTDTELVSLLAEEGAGVPLGRIMTGPSSFGANVEAPLTRYPTILKHRLICQALDEDYELELALTEKLAAELDGIPESQCRALLGLNIPTEIPRANIRFGDLPSEVSGRAVDPSRNYPDVSTYARAYAKDAFASTSIVVTTPELERGSKAEHLLSTWFHVPGDGPSPLVELLDAVKPLGWYGSRASLRLDVALACIRTALEVAAERLTAESGAPKKRIEPATVADSLWIRGAIAIQELVCTAQEVLAVSGCDYPHPYTFETTATGRSFSPKLSDHLFVLDQEGMIRSQRVPVPRTGGGPHSLRYDYQVTREGRSYTDALFATEGWTDCSAAIRSWLQGLDGTCVDCGKLAVGLAVRGEICTPCAESGRRDRNCSVWISSGIDASS